MNPDPPSLPPPRPHPHSHPPNRLHDLHSSNSTATLFLGSARRPWMNAANLPSDNVAAPAHQPAAALRSSDSALMSPATPGENLPHPDPKSFLPATSPSVAPAATDSVPPPSLPSPASSNDSPANVPDGNPQVLSRRASSTSPPAAPAHASSSAPGPISAADPSADPSTSSNVLVGPPTPNQPPLNVPSAPSADGPEPAFTNQFWSALHARLSTFADTPEEGSSVPLSDDPRVRLLRDACVEQDLLYLVFHQVYCLHTTDMRRLAALPEFSLANLQGFNVAQELLMPNWTISPAIIKFSAEFPLELSQGMKCADYRDALLQVARCLSCFSERWPQLDRNVRARGYPPLIDEMVHLFDVTSTVLLAVISLSMCRRIHHETRISELQAVFDRDKQNYEQRFAAGRYPVGREQISSENKKIIGAYLAIQPRLRQARPGGSPAVPRNNPRPSQRAPPSHPAANGYTLGSAPGQVFRTLPPFHQVPGVPVSQPPWSPGATGPGPRAMALGSAPNPSLDISQTSPPIPQNQMASPATANHQQPPTMSSAPRQTRSFARASRPIMQNQMISPVATPNQQSTMAARPAAISTSPGQHPRFSQHQQNYSSPSVMTANHQPPMAMPSAQGQSLGFPRAQANPQNHITMTPSNTARQGTQQASVMHGPITQPQQKPRPRYTMFLPPPGHIPPYTVHPNPLRVALHQAHLRDPVKKLIRMGPQGMEEGELFQFLSSFAVPPQPLGLSKSSFKWKFSVSHDDYQRFPRSITSDVGQRALRIYTQGCHLYHLKCIKLAPSTKTISQHAWSVADCAWPSVVYIFINDVEHFVRRKVHYGKDLPVDITDALREGENNVSFYFLRSPSERKDISYALAIETMDVTAPNQVKQLVRTIPAIETSTRIQQQLSSSGSDDELSVVNDDINVDLVDPFSAQVFNIPVRGVACRHLECFDLDNFLSTKASKSGKVPMEWDWRCPICREDARPPSLAIDQYLLNVRQVLAHGNRLQGAKGIRVKSDGSWELRAEAESQTEGQRRAVPAKRKPDDSIRSPDRRPTQRPKTDDSSGSTRDPQSAEVIELD